VKTIGKPKDDAEARFTKKQEAARKDAKRAFSVLQSCWAIIRHLARSWSHAQLWEVITACVIMHNMIVNEERDDIKYGQGWEFEGELAMPQSGPLAYFADFLQMHHEM
jgi:hypothetical protein